VFGGGGERNIGKARSATQQQNEEEDYLSATDRKKPRQWGIKGIKP